MKVSQNLEDLQNLLIKLTVKASSEKAWLLYEFSFSLSLYLVSTEDQFQANSKKN